MRRLRLISLTILLSMALVSCLPQVIPNSEMLTLQEGPTVTLVTLETNFSYVEGVVYFGGTRYVTTDASNFECGLFNRGVICTQSAPQPPNEPVHFRAVPVDYVSASMWLINLDTGKEVIATARKVN